MKNPNRIPIINDKMSKKELDNMFHDLMNDKNDMDNLHNKATFSRSTNVSRMNSPIKGYRVKTTSLTTGSAISTNKRNIRKLPSKITVTK